MSNYIANVIADSVSPHGGPRLTTIHAKYPRYVHSEVLTHRNFSRNARSSRAVPNKVLVAEKPYVPYMKANKRGMQPGEDLSEEEQVLARMLWESGAKQCQDLTRKLAKIGVHKQWTNRPLEWFGYIDVLMTGTEQVWEAFFKLRCHHAAQEEIQVMANLCKFAMQDSTPVERLTHRPYWTDVLASYSVADIDMILSARCARVSYKPFTGNKEDPDDDLRLSNDLLYGHDLPHASSFEHVCLAGDPEKRYANHQGWISHRYVLGI